MTIINKSNYDIKKSKSGHFIPVKDGVFLHSNYNPETEAKKFISENINKIENNSNFIVFGLGFGYHIFELQKQESVKSILVIEPDQHIVNLYVKNRIHSRLNAQIICKSIDELYRDNFFLNFLLKSPSILVHKTSYSFDRSYYDEILKYRVTNKKINKDHFTDDFKEFLDHKKQNKEKFYKLYNYLTGQ
jgi:hypothetical protein